jgi:hypothetical protein
MPGFQHAPNHVPSQQFQCPCNWQAHAAPVAAEAQHSTSLSQGLAKPKRKERRTTIRPVAAAAKQKACWPSPISDDTHLPQGGSSRGGTHLSLLLVGREGGLWGVRGSAVCSYSHHNLLGATGRIQGCHIDQPEPVCLALAADCLPAGGTVQVLAQQGRPQDKDEGAARLQQQASPHQRTLLPMLCQLHQAAHPPF